MADNKRQSMAGKVATPKVGPNKESDGDAILYKAVGARIRVAFAPENNVVEGTLFTACNLTNAIAVNTAPAPPNPSVSLTSQPCDYHIIPFAHITNFEILAPGQRAAESGFGSESILASISKADMDALKAREEQTVRELKKEDAKRGKGVTKEAQELFDHVARMLPARWDEARIIVNDAVVIEPPYGLDNVKAPKGKEQSLTHVRKLVERHVQRKKEAAGGSRAPVATPVAPRKGG